MTSLADTAELVDDACSDVHHYRHMWKEQALSCEGCGKRWAVMRQDQIAEGC